LQFYPQSSLKLKLRGGKNSDEPIAPRSGKILILAAVKIFVRRRNRLRTAAR